MKFSLLLLCTMLFAVVVSSQTVDKMQSAADLFVSSYNANEPDKISDRFNTQMKAAVPAEVLKGSFELFSKELGRIKELGQPRHVSKSVYVYPVTFEKGKRDLLIALDDEGRIAGLQLREAAPEIAKNTSRNQTKMILPFKGEWTIGWAAIRPHKTIIRITRISDSHSTY